MCYRVIVGIFSSTSHATKIRDEITINQLLLRKRRYLRSFTYVILLSIKWLYWNYRRVSPAWATAILVLKSPNFTLFYPIDWIAWIQLIYIREVSIIKVVMFIFIVRAIVSLLFLIYVILQKSSLLVRRNLTYLNILFVITRSFLKSSILTEKFFFS